MKRTLWLILFAFILTGCSQISTLVASVAPALSTPLPPTLTALLPETQTPTPEATATALPTSTPELPLLVGYQAGVPSELFSQITLPDGYRWATSAETANFLIAPAVSQDGNGSNWIYALVAPFPTVRDDLSLADLQAFWRGEQVSGLENARLYVTPATRAAFEALWGQASSAQVQDGASDADLVSLAWDNQPALALVPFESLEPRWKVLSVDGQTPLSKTFDPGQYPLTVHFTWQGENLPADLPALSATNRDPDKMTVITMTGVTALVRATGYMMDVHGVLYPGGDIRDWMQEADFTHISNEVSFDPTCPPQDPGSTSLTFCSQPGYIQLLEDMSVDIVELTGNHLMDYKKSSLAYTLDLYRQRGWLIYGAGAILQEARQPVTFEHHGNKFAFIGCNPAGPENDWAWADSPGTATCDYEWMKKQIRQLSDQGYIVITTLQYYESYSPIAFYRQVEDFRSLSEAGATIVSGSQAHLPQGFDFDNGKFIHFGLGNLFFDQMDYPVVGTRREFLDRHVFYNGRHISTELLTAMLENYARPRPMTPAERKTFLQDLFRASGW